MAGIVQVDGERVDKPGTRVAEDAALEVLERGEPYVSRGGRKLEAALDALGVDPTGRVCLDVGASTGGFTDCLLQRGAVRVYALDVGYGQLDYQLRTDSRVVVMERINVRHLPPDALPEPVELITVDVSFISLLKVVPALLPHLASGEGAEGAPGGAPSGASAGRRFGELLVLIKPQFEAGRGQVGKGGIVRDEALRRRAIQDTVEGIAALGLEAVGVVDSAVPGAGGNREAFALFRAGARSGSREAAGSDEGIAGEASRAGGGGP